MTTTVEDCGSVDHAVAVPESDEQLWQISAEFLAHGLLRGEHVIYFDDGTTAEEGRALLSPHLPDRLLWEPTMIDGARRAVALAGS